MGTGRRFPGGRHLGSPFGRLAAALFAVIAVTVPLQPFSPPHGFAASVVLHHAVGSLPAHPAAMAAQATTTPAGTDTATPGAPTATPGTSPVPEPALPHNYVVLIVVDANRPSYYSLTRLPHIQALMHEGVVYDRAWVGEMESSTPDVHVTLGTGTLPRENGFLGFGWAAPQTRRTVDFRDLLANHEIDPVLNSLPVPSVATRLHRSMPNAVSVAASGHKDYAAVGLGGGTATYELYGKFVNRHFQPTFMHAPPPLSPAQLQSLTVPSPLAPGGEDSWAFRYALDVVQKVRPRLLMINLPELDTWGHWYGPASTATFRRLMLNVDRGIGAIEDTYRKLGILQRTDFIITADHSMMESRAAHNWHLVWQAASAANTGVARADGEGGSVWLQNPLRAQAVAQRLVAMHPAHVDAIFYRSAPGLTYHYVLASPLSWLAGPTVATALEHLVDTTAGRNGPDVWVLYRENYTVVPRNVQGVWKGTHGGPTWKVQNIPLVLAGPGISSGVHSQFPARSIDIAPTMEHLLGLPPIHRDGVVLADAMLNATDGEKNVQNAVAPKLAADVEALQAQSRADDRQPPIWPTVSQSILHCKITLGTAAPWSLCTIKPGTPTNQ